MYAKPENRLRAYNLIRKWHRLATELVGAGEHIQRPFESIARTALTDICETHPSPRLIDAILRRSSISRIAREAGEAAVRDPEKLHAISNFAFMHFFFSRACEELPELKKFRLLKAEELGIVHKQLYDSKKAAQELSNAVNARRKAEELHRKGYSHEAIKLLAEAVDIYPSDPIALFFMGTITLYDLGSPNGAVEYYKKAAAAAREHSPWIFSRSMGMISLAHGLAGTSGNADEARSAASVALAADPESLFTRYGAAIRNITRQPAPESAGESAGPGAMLEELFSADALYAVQASCDPLSALSGELFETMFKKTAATAGEKCRGAIDSMTPLAAAIPARADKMPESTKVFPLVKEFKAIRTAFDAAPALVELSALAERAVRALEELKRLSVEVEKSRLCSEISKFLDNLLPEYRRELDASLTPFSSLSDRKSSAAGELAQLMTKYPVPERGSVPGDGSPDWRRTAEYDRVRATGSIYAFAAVEAIAVLVYSTISSFGAGGLAVATVVNFALWGIYGSLYAMAFAARVENRKRELEIEVNKAEFKLELNKRAPGEAEIRIRDKYAKMVAEQFAQDPTDARNMLLSAIDGEHEKIRNYIRVPKKKA